MGSAASIESFQATNNDVDAKIVDQAFAKYDADGNGFIDATELKALIQQVARDADSARNVDVSSLEAALAELKTVLAEKHVTCPSNVQCLTEQIQKLECIIIRFSWS